MNIRFESPLNWPEWMAVTPRTSQKSDHGFPTPLTMADSIGYLQQEMQELSGSGVLYLDIEQPLVERLRKKVGSRLGACLHIKYHGRSYVIACDRWLTVEANIYAIHLALRQWRNMERWGIGNIPTLLRGFEPGQSTVTETEAPPTGAIQPWMEALGLGPSATLDDAIAVYHRRAKQISHDEDALTHLNLMITQARAHFGRSE